MIGYAICGSFCNHKIALEQMKALTELGYEILPIISKNSASLDIRFGTHEELLEKVVAICGREPVLDIVEAEQISSTKAADCVIVSPCTGNTLAKLANGITDGAVTMSVKAHLRNRKPVVIALATNDALGTNFKNIAALYDKKCVFFVPLRQDDSSRKATSLVCDFRLIPDALFFALQGVQIQPFMIE